LSDKIRKNICDAAVRAAKAINYEGAGTIEFLLDKDNNWYFMEMNTRLQVEHGISEMYAGIDLVKAQIRVAQGLPLGFKQDDIRFSGHVIECRINAEDADKNFMPCPGEITGYIAPGGYGVRVDSHVYTGYKIPPYYDSLVGKLMCAGKDRADAIATMKRALGEYVITDVKTTIPYHIKVLDNAVFQSGNFDTSFLENFNQEG
jgi:acetyl-CoA carboxylase biotin carboxylase subunit